MSSRETAIEDTLTYLIVRNHEEQYSIWPVDKQIPPGWKAEGFRGGQDECLARIETLWTDMRPLSLRRQMAEQASVQTVHAFEPNAPSIVERLCALEEQPVRVCGALSSPAFKQAIARGFV